MKKLRSLMAFVGTKNLIAIGALLVLVIAINIGIAISNSKTEEKANDELEEHVGLQVEENEDDVEGGSTSFSEFQPEDEKKNDAGNKQGSGDKTQTGNNGQTGNGQSGSGSDSGNGGLTEHPDDGGNGDSGNGGTTSSEPEFGPFI